MQKKLNVDQISEFYHDGFVSQQVDHFSKLCKNKLQLNDIVVDVGGGCGFFAKVLMDQMDVIVRVVDADSTSVREAQELGVSAEIGDALCPEVRSDEKIVCFNLILHHLISDTDIGTAKLQMQAISSWHDTKSSLFVNEYIYESLFNDFSGWFIYQITKSNALSSIAKTIAYVFPTLRANTFGVGVRFRDRNNWHKLFHSAGYRVVDEIKGDEENVSIARRILLIKSIRRDSYLLERI